MNIADPLVSAEWLKSHLDAPDVRVVDATWIAPWTDAYSHETALRLYKEAHIPGSVYFDIDEIADTESPLPHMLPSAEKFSSRVRKLGLGDGHRIVIYDRGNFVASARVWWMFRVMGHEDVRVLDGGWNAWLDINGPVEDLPPLTTERHFTARVQNHLLKNYSQIVDAIDRDDTLILDARASGRFEGTTPEPREDLPSGHMPSSINIPSTSLVTENGLMKSTDELATIFKGVEDDATLITSCGSGVTAAILLLALQRLGRDDAALYDGSWTEYASISGSEIVSK